jgi:hypothetical protein
MKTEDAIWRQAILIDEIRPGDWIRVEIPILSRRNPILGPRAVVVEEIHGPIVRVRAFHRKHLVAVPLSGIIEAWRTR